MRLRSESQSASWRGPRRLSRQIDDPRAQATPRHRPRLGRGDGRPHRGLHRTAALAAAPRLISRASAQPGRFSGTRVRSRRDHSPLACMEEGVEGQLSSHGHRLRLSLWCRCRLQSPRRSRTRTHQRQARSMPAACSTHGNGTPGASSDAQSKVLRHARYSAWAAPQAGDSAAAFARAWLQSWISYS